MPRTKKNPAADAALPVLPSQLIDQSVKGPDERRCGQCRLQGV